jgi:uncharacterized spore protein YtfJ
MTNPTDMIEKIAHSVTSKATVDAVFGEPIHVEGKVVVPVARVAYGFGGGGGSGSKSRENAGEPLEGGGGGGGGGAVAYPAGALEITETETRFIPFTDWRPIIAGCASAFSMGILIGKILGRRRS